MDRHEIERLRAQGCITRATPGDGPGSLLVSHKYEGTAPPMALAEDCEIVIEKCGAGKQQGVRTITGEVLHINGTRLLVKQTDGEEVIYQINLSTKISGDIRPGNRIQAKVNEVEGERLVISIDLAR